jgi:hypothetical protein
MRRRSISTRYAAAIRKMIITANKTAAQYGLSEEGNPSYFSFFYFNPTGPQSYQFNHYVELAQKKIDQRLSLLPVEEADRLVEGAYYWSLSTKNKELYDIRKNYENLKKRVAVVEKELSITI